MPKVPSEIQIQVDASAIANVPHIDQWCGPWAIVPGHLQMMAEAIRSLDLRSHLQNVADGKNEHLASGHGGDYYADYTRTVDGIAIVGIAGVLMKHQASMSRNTSTVMLRRSIRLAANDAQVRGIMLSIDSPGGTVSGTSDLAEEIAAAAKMKTTHAYIEDLGASAAYWVASQASHLSAGPTALVGSIGTFAVVEDFSKFAEEKGIKVHVVRAGDFKGAGIPGTEVTDEQLAEMQRVIDGLNAHFLDGVASGRGLSRSTVQALNDGRIHLADAATDLKLIDAVESFGDAFDRLNQATNSNRSIRMSTEAPAKVEKTKDEPKTADPTPTPKTLDQRAELKRYMNAFGDTAGAKYFAEGLEYTESCEAHIIALDEQVKEANTRADQAEEKLASLDTGEETPVDTGAPAKGEKQAGSGWNSLFRQRGEGVTAK